MPEAIVLAGLLPVIASLTKILVGHNRLGDEGATILCDALREIGGREPIVGELCGAVRP